MAQKNFEKKKYSKNRVTEFDPKLFAVDRSMSKSGMHLVKMNNGVPYPHKINLYPSQIQKFNGGEAVRIDKKVTSAWRTSGFYEQLITLGQYNVHLSKMANQGQKELNERIFTSAMCNLAYHIFTGEAVEKQDFIHCNKCGYSRCSKCNYLVEGAGQTPDEIAGHWGLIIAEFRSITELPKHKWDFSLRCQEAV